MGAASLRSLLTEFRITGMGGHCELYGFVALSFNEGVTQEAMTYTRRTLPTSAGSPDAVGVTVQEVEHIAEGILCRCDHTRAVRMYLFTVSALCVATLSARWTEITRNKGHLQYDSLHLCSYLGGEKEVCNGV